MDEDSWKPLLSAALGVLDELRARGFGAPDIVLGGGTVLMMRLRHRLSRDIDLFLHDAQWLGLLTPRLNASVASLAANYVEQANSLKIVLAGGDVDFIVSGDVTGLARTERLDFAGWSLPLESSEEILAKKLYFRAALLKPRDIFDLVAVARSAPDVARRALMASSTRREEQMRRLAALAAKPEPTDISALGAFADLPATMYAEATALFASF